jgi:K+-transporting ATPase ATPase A chain
MLLDFLELGIALALLYVLVFPVGRYIAAVFTGRHLWVDRVFDPLDSAIYRLAGVDPRGQQRWRPYFLAVLVTNAVMFAMLFVILQVQHLLPLNPDDAGPVNVFLAFNTAASFITNTNWQNYGGENTLSYFSQLFAIIFPQFTSAATGLACGAAFIRGLAGNRELGNFYVDLTRITTRILLPIAFAAAIAFVALGVPATFAGAAQASTLDGVQQTITRGPIAALESIKHLGTNGGGWFNTNSAHPFEDPSPLSNILQLVLMAILPMGLVYAFGVMTNRMRQAWTFFWVMSAFFVGFLIVAYVGEVYGNPLLNALGLDPAQGNMEGHEVRFGQALTALFVTATTAFTTGTVNAMHDSLTPLASITPLAQMMLNMVFGGKGVGLINLAIFVILAVFLTGLMVGRTPEFLGKKIEAHEVKLAAAAFLMHPLLILGSMAMTLALSLDLGSIFNLGSHGFSELLYMFTSEAANNGSAFGGITGNTNWFNTSGGIVMLLGRYVSIALMLALAGSLAAKRAVPVTIGTMRTDDRLFGGVLAGTVLIIGALTFFPTLALGPIAEHLAMLSGKAL